MLIDLSLPALRRRIRCLRIGEVFPAWRRLLPGSLGARILLAGLVVQVPLFAVLLAHNARLVERALTEQFTLRVDNLKPLLNSALAPLLLSRDYGALAERLRDTRSDEDIEYLVLRDASDTPVASAGWSGAQALPLASRQVIDERGIFHTFVLIEAGGRKYGTLNLGLSTTRLAAYRDELQRKDLLIFVIGVLAICAVNAWLAYWVTRRLRRLTRASEDVARGRFELHLEESGNDEMARLAASMNTMSGAVRDKIRRLEEGEERMRLAMDAGRVVPWDRDLADDVLRWGAGAERLLGPLPAGRDTYPDLLTMVSPEHRDQLLQARKRAIRNKTAYQLDLNVRRTDGAQVWLAVRGKYMHIPGFAAGRLIGVARDITAGKKAEIEINRLNRELEQRVRERTQELEAAVVELEAFSYTISHDLRAPLRTLGGFSRLLAQECAANPACNSRSVYLDRIEGNVHKMSRMVDDLLRFSKAARAPLSRRQVEPNQLVSEVLDDVQFPDAARAEIRVSAMPPCWADPALLRQVYVNLLSNALKYSAKADRPCVEIGVLTNADGEAVYSVRDNGAGFDASRADRLFGVFQRFHSSSEFEGTGVGLAIVQRIVIRHGGRIWAESTPGNGAAFYFTLAARARCEERAETGKPPVAAISSA